MSKSDQAFIEEGFFDASCKPLCAKATEQVSMTDLGC